MKKYIHAFVFVIFLLQSYCNAQSNFTTGIASTAPVNNCGSTILTANSLSDVWVQKKNFGGGPNCFGVSFRILNKGYAFIGYSNSLPVNEVWEYDWQTDSWTQKASFIGVLRAGAAGFSVGSKGYVGTGNLSSATFTLLDDFYEFDPLANVWAPKANFISERQSCTGLSIGNKGYIGLGLQNGSPDIAKDFWEYDPATDAWTQKADFGGGRRTGAPGFSIGNKGYVGTGYDDTGLPYNDFWEYDPLTNVWTQKANFGGPPLGDAAGFHIGTKGYIGAGGDNASCFNDFWEYDPLTDNWTQRANIPGALRFGTTAFELDCKGYLGMGRTFSFILQEDFWEYNPFVTYLWSNGSTAQTIVADLTGVYTVTATNITGCTATASVAVTVIPSPTVSVNSATICSASAVVLTGTVTPMAGTIYIWSTGSAINSITVSPTTTTAYTLTATNAGCSTSVVSSVSVSTPSPAITGFSYGSPVCMTDTNPLPNTVSGFSSNGIFSSSSGLNINSATGSIDLGSSLAGSYTVTYSVSGSDCILPGSGTAGIVINNPSMSAVNFNYPSPLCSSEINVTPIITSGVFSNGGIFSSTPSLNLDAATGIFNPSTSNVGTYTVTYSNNTLYCVLPSTTTAVIVINQTPTISVNPDVAIVRGSSASLVAGSSTGNYQWYPQDDLSCAACPNPVASPGETTTYCVKTTDGICSNSVCVTVDVEDPCFENKDLELPNAFSPNGDGKNDEYCLRGWSNCVTNFRILIYDRWGEKVFESLDPDFCWDGMYKGRLLDPGVFVYNLQGLYNGKTSLNKKGNVTLIK